MPKVRWVLSYGVYSKFHTLSSSAKILKIDLRFDKVRDSLKVGRFLRHNVDVAVESFKDMFSHLFEYDRWTERQQYMPC